jgi:hypothetical protein
MGMIRCRKNSPRKRGKESPIIPSQRHTARKDFGFVVKARGLHNPDLAEAILMESKKTAERAVTLSGKQLQGCGLWRKVSPAGRNVP